MAIYPKRFNHSMIRPDGKVHYVRWLHIDHCIESIRQSLTCNADISATTYKWTKSKRIDPVMNVVHKCRDFDRLQEWVKSRWVPWGNRQSHVENGQVVDYSQTTDSLKRLGDDFTPPGWEYTAEDM
jgi:Mycotoxin biosynthesis protein UstYa